MKKQTLPPLPLKTMSNSGFGLLEVMIGFLVLTIALIPLIGLTAAHYKQVVESGKKDTALYLAQQKLEEYKSKKIIEEDAIIEEISFDDPFASYKYKVFPLGDNTYRIEIYYQDSEQPLAALTGEIATE